MSNDPVLQLALGALAIVATVVLLVGLRIRRHADLVRNLAAKYSLARVRGRAVTELADRVRRYRGTQHKVKLKDVLAREDEHGRYVLARRRIGRLRHQILFFEVEDTVYLRGFHVVPVPPNRPRFSWLRRWRRTKARERRTDWDLHLHWTAPRSHWTEERALSMGARVLYHMAEIGESERATMLGVEVHERQVFIHSRGRVPDADLDRFISDAMRLRRLLLASLRRASAIQSGRKSASVRVPRFEGAASRSDG
jgi:hypothetical protein